eukprot:CAMPEP_0195015034 /NCGR_PEP_ID=MMETSP0326_2-20130528/17692_1 /TAXON_ID=2866 ORGANISM="Crypthecodinium cohnii, Strain Seligo" /NCGR_SAMPLE_ID=MMETSP0326_2 /ASSEMBLY_ACC=CAM_ASM_000348 /LENGTH=36 /DNA_ID= /DNA_START= /DNA_END= /DNA_ORIENTATION=
MSASCRLGPQGRGLLAPYRPTCQPAHLPAYRPERQR